ncbi:ParM/StbA family protein [Leptolyngbyaceae cyanobacterium UHCC 1019]
MVSVTAVPISTSTPEKPATIYLAGDLGKSACKFLYWNTAEELQPLWLGSDVAEGVSPSVIHKFDAAGDLAESVWLQLGGSTILVGNSAADYGSSFSADKVQVAAYQVVAALGLAAIHLGIQAYNAVISLAVPLNEYRFKAEIETRLREIGEGVVFCGRQQQFTVTPSFYPEGTGLYLLHKKEREQAIADPYTRRVVVLMMGHRNLSVLVFEGGRLNANQSQTSDNLGFWNCFKADATSSGIRETDYPSLMAAVTSGKPQQLSKVAGGLKDFSTAAQAVREGLTSRVETFCRDNVMDLLINSDRQTDVLIGGGVAHVMRSELRDYFTELGLAENLYFADIVGGRLLTLAEQTRNAQGDLARPLRFADVYGLAQALAGKVNRGR